MKDSPVSWQSPPERLFLPADEVHVWRAALDLDATRIQDLQDLLSPDERERADQFRFPIHRQRFIAARGLLRTVLARYLATQPKTLRFRYGPFGKPALADAASAGGLCFNVAHSEGLALFAVARNREVGVDLESLGRKLADDQIAERFFSPNEVAALRALPAELQREGFFNCWTRKEAYIKARGKGLSLPLNQFTVSLSPGEPARLLATPGEPAEASKWTLRELSPGEGFAAALAVKGDGWQLRCWEWQFTDGR
jgi:4'-phosphopantetheinyl transferase